MNQYWKENSATGKWHFIRNTEYIRTYTGGASKVLGKLLDKKSKLSLCNIFGNIIELTF